MAFLLTPGIKGLSIHLILISYDFRKTYERVRKDLKLKSRIKTEQSQIILQRLVNCCCKSGYISIMLYVIGSIIEQLKGKTLESITPDEFHLVEKVHENSYKKSFQNTKKRHVQKFIEFISKNKVTQSATNIT